MSMDDRRIGIGHDVHRLAPGRALTLGGVEIPADQLVLLQVGAANRDARQFANPDVLDVTRDPNPHLAFGHGAHFCLGAPLARLEARVALTALLERFSKIQLAGERPWEPRKGLHVHGPTRLPISVA